MALKKIDTKDAAGSVIPHDLTKVVPGSYKGPAFKKGHLVKPEDIPHLLDIGKAHIYVLELGPDELHEDEAIGRLAKAVCGPGLVMNPPGEGRINLKASVSGLVKIDIEAVDEINDIPDAIISTIHQNQMVKEGDLVAAVKVVPLVVPRALAEKAEAISAKHSPVISVTPLPVKKAAFIIVAGEVFSGRIKDKFGPVLKEKATRYGLTVNGEDQCPDDQPTVTAAILKQAQAGAEIIIAAGGMSVDPDDITPAAIKATGAEVVTYGTPVLPGGMFMLAYLGTTAIIGLPACGMAASNTVLDLVLPRLMLGEKLTKKDFTRMGYGGLCRACPSCNFESCAFGRR